MALISGDIDTAYFRNLLRDGLADFLRNLLAFLVSYRGTYFSWHLDTFLARYAHTHRSANLSWHILALFRLDILANVPLDSLALLLWHNSLNIGTLGLWHIGALLLGYISWHLL